MSAVGARLTAALGVILAALAVALEATTFDVAFPTDPLGPKAFPLVAAGLLVLGGGALLLEARRAAAEASATEPARDAGAVPGGGHPVPLAAASFIGYALLLAPLGFVPATTVAFAVLARLFGGTWMRGAAVGLVFALLLYALFVYALGLPLPLGVFEA